MNIGIVVEYNPFHYGHLYQIRKIKEMYPNCNIIIAMSGWITERGDISMIDKFDKAKIALHYGIDLVAEIPFKFIQSSDYFAKGAIGILNKLGCDKIIFGSESDDIDKLFGLAKIQLNDKNYDTLVKKYLDEGINYPTAMSNALKTICGNTINTPNDLLGLSYIKEILKNNYNITCSTIKRTSNYNSKQIEGKITSATSIRENIKNNKKFKKYVPNYSYKFLNNPIFLDDYFNYLKYKIISTKDLTTYQGVDTNLENRIKKVINKSQNLEDLLKLLKTKRYTYNRLKRTLTYILFSIEKDNFSNLDLEYIRILGFNEKGKNILNKIKKDIDIPIIVKYNNRYLYKDLNINEILSLNNKIKDKNRFIEKEYKEKTIITDVNHI